MACFDINKGSEKEATKEIRVILVDFIKKIDRWSEKYDANEDTLGHELKECFFDWGRDLSFAKRSKAFLMEELE